MKHIGLLFSVLALVAFTAPAHAVVATPCDPSTAVCLGLDCKSTDIGKTTMDYNKEHIIACLKQGAGYKWKSMSSSGSEYPINHGTISSTWIRRDEYTSNHYDVRCEAKTDANGLPYMRIYYRIHPGSNPTYSSDPWVQTEFTSSVNLSDIFCVASPKGISAIGKDRFTLVNNFSFVPWD